MTDILPGDVVFPPAVKAMQEAKGSRDSYRKMEERGAFRNVITPELAAFIAGRDSFYLATASADGQPYIQHRGGRLGFLKVLGERTLGFADFRGNRQYITAGNLSENDKAYIFLMDYANRRRIKIWGRAWIVEDDPDLLDRLSDTDYQGRPERAILFQITAWDVNCPQHITQRFSEVDMDELLQPYLARIRELEGRLAALGEGMPPKR